MSKAKESMLEVGIGYKASYKASFVQHQREFPNMTGKIAITLVEKWGMVAAIQDGEDTAGRSKVRLQETDELVKRAVDTAEKLVAVLTRKGHITVGPTLKQVNNDLKEADRDY